MCAFVGGCAREESVKADASATEAFLDPSIRSKLDKMSSEERRQFVSQRLEVALKYIGRDPSLGTFMDSIFGVKEQRASFELVADVPRLAEAVGFEGFQGDAFTISAEVINKVSKQSQFRHVINLAPECFASDGKLIVVVMHELIHMRRREQGVPMVSPVLEEQETFSEGIRRAMDLASSLKLPPINNGVNGDAQRIGHEIEAALMADRKLLAIWLRRPR